MAFSMSSIEASPLQAPAEDTHATLRLQSLDACRGTCKGPVFIVASGPSAKDFPIEEFRHIPMITVNGAISLFLEAQIAPFFYICTDMGFPVQQPHLYKAALKQARNVVIRREGASSARLEGQGNLYLLDKAQTPGLAKRIFRRDHDLVHAFSMLSRRQSTIGFSRNLSKGLVDGRTVAYAALQLAYHLGFNEVYLVGMDLNQSLPRFYEGKTGKASPSTLDRHYGNRILPSLQFMARNIVGPAFTVYNLSQVSRVPSGVIPVLSLDEVRAKLA